MNIYVSNLSFNVQDEDLREFFAPYGEVTSAKIINDRETGKSRGFGFVKMVTTEQAEAAKEGLQGEEFEGRVLSIEKARRNRPRTPTPGKYFGPPKRGKLDFHIHSYDAVQV